jgi:membrane protease YdiL (CAAX protease family)
MTRSDLLGRSGIRALLGFLAIWGAAVAYIAGRGGDWTFPIASLGIFGLGLGSIIWFLTRKMDAPAVPVEQPARQSIGLLVYLAIYAVLLIGVWLGTIKHAIPPGPTQEFAVLAYKLIIHVAIPAGILLALGSRLNGMFDLGMNRRGFWPALVVLCGLMFALLAVVSPSLKQIGALNLGAGVALAWVVGSWAWLSVEAGVCEEFLFRVCLQSRLTAWMKSPTAAIVVTSLLFGLSHWPGLYLRGGPGVDGWSTDPVQVAAYTVSTLAPLSLAIGLLWARTRSLLLIVLVHGAIDALPNTAEFVGIWS